MMVHSSLWHMFSTDLHSWYSHAPPTLSVLASAAWSFPLAPQGRQCWQCPVSQVNANSERDAPENVWSGQYQVQRRSWAYLLCKQPFRDHCTGECRRYLTSNILILRFRKWPIPKSVHIFGSTRRIARIIFRKPDKDVVGCMRWIMINSHQWHVLAAKTITYTSHACCAMAIAVYQCVGLLSATCFSPNAGRWKQLLLTLAQDGV